MDKAAALAIAKAKKSTIEELRTAMGFGTEVDLLLVKHPDITGEMLEELYDCIDDKVSAAVLMHPNVVDTDLLEMEGDLYPLAMFKNPALPGLMKIKKNFLGQFEGDEWEKAFRSKGLPDFVIDWLLAQGKAELQVIFLSAPKRSDELVARFRESKHAAVLAALLDKDPVTLSTWAMDLGLGEAESFSQNIVTLGTQLDAAIAGTKPLLPELNSALKTFEDVFFKKGRVLPKDEFNFYEAFITWFEGVGAQPPIFSKLVQKIIDFDLALVRQYGGPEGIKAAKESAGRKYYERSGVQRSLTRLQAVLSVWCQDQPADKLSELAKSLNSLLAYSPIPIDAAQGKAEKQVEQAKRALWRSNHIAWAKDLGFDESAIDEQNGVELIDAIDEWVEQLWSHNAVLWKELVPKSGPAPTVQGELVRALGRLESEHFRNGMMNWGDGSGYYEGFVEFIHATLKQEKSFTKLVKTALHADIKEIKLSGAEGQASASGKGHPTGSVGSNFFVPSDVEKSHQRIGALITIWCKTHPEPIALNVKQPPVPE